MRRKNYLTLLAILGLFNCALAASASAAPSSAIFSLVMGFNRAPSSSLAPLKYADDDAAQNFMLMRDLGANTVLLSEFDSNTQRIFPEAAAVASKPNSANLRTALHELNLRIDQAKREGKKTTLFFFYSGHGDVEAGEGFVYLDDQKLKRTELLQLLRKSHADTNHVVIDACKSYFLIFSRGKSGERRRAAAPFLPADQELPPNTGIFLSSSSSKDSHEWEAYQGGVFSHELRSALRGGADLNGDNIISYEEAAAFIFSANQRVPNERYRPSFFSLPQGGKRADQAVLVELGMLDKASRVVFGPKMSRHYYVETRRGVRLADIHPDEGHVSIVVPNETLFVRESDGEQREYVVAAPVLVAALEKITPRPRDIEARGAEHEAFKQLFAHCYDQSMLLAYRQAPPEEIVLNEADFRPAWEKNTKLVLAATAVLTLGTGAIFTAMASASKGNINDSTSQLERYDINQTIDRDNKMAIGCYIAGGLISAGLLTWHYWPRPHKELRFQLALSPTGAATVWGSF